MKLYDVSQLSSVVKTMLREINLFNACKIFFIISNLVFISPSQSAELSLSPFGLPSYFGVNLGLSTIDISSKTFREQGQDISVDIDEKSQVISLFFVAPLNQTSGIEISFSQFGSYAFLGNITGNLNIGDFEGEQTYQGLGINAYYQKSFKQFATRVHLGLVETRIVTEGSIDLVGKAKQSMNDTEFSTNTYLSLETNKTIYKDWSLGPSFSILNSSDPIQSFSLKLSKELKN